MRSRAVHHLAGWLGVGAVQLAALVLASVLAVPYPTGVLDAALTPSVQVTDRDGHLLRHIPRPDGTRCVPVPLDSTSPWLIEATLASEDHRFEAHPGVDVWAMARAVELALEHGRLYSGASTLTMQLVRLLNPTAPRGPWRKAEELLLALRLDATLTKPEILGAYLNLAPYGHGQRGVEAASRYYWGRPAASLTLGQAATLAVLPRAPTWYDPFAHPERLRRRRAHILRLMRRRGLIDEPALKEALATPIPARSPCSDPEACPAGSGPPPFEAPHFVDAVLRPPLPGAQLRTTLDLDLQRRVEAAAQRHAETLDDPGAQVAVVVLDTRTAEVLALVGSRSFRGPQGQVNGALAPRQPGSTLKPFVYGLAFERGASPSTVYPDVSTEFDLGGGQLWRPANFDGRFRGPVSARTALAGSLNVPAVVALQEVGVRPLLDTLRAAGLEHLDRDAGHYGLGLALGDGEASLLELTGAYATLGRGGVHRTPRWLVGAEPDGDEQRQVMLPAAVFMVTDILSDELARGQTFGFGTALRFPWPVAVKTGTSAGHRDAWTVGFTAEVTVGVWVGRFDGAPVAGQSGAATAGPLFVEVLREAMVSRPPGLRPAPPGLVRDEVCALSGMAAGAHCPHRQSDWFVLGSTPSTPCAWHVERRVDRGNGLLASSECPEGWTEGRRFVAWPPELAAWAEAHGQAGAPTAWSPRCPAEGAGSAVTVVEPPHGAVYLLDPSRPTTWQTIRWVARSSQPATVRWLLDGEAVTPTHESRAIDRVEGRWALVPGRHRLEAVGGDGARDAVEFEVQ